MASLRPEVEALRERHGSDKQRFDAELMALYRHHGVNPLSGCLMTLLSVIIGMLVVAGLYSALRTDAEIGQAPFLWVPTLGRRDPRYGRSALSLGLT